MKKFSFPLDRALSWRSLRREQERAVLQKLYAERDALAGRERALIQERSSFERELVRSIHVDASFLAAVPNWQVRLKGQIAALAGERAKLGARIEEQQTRALEAERQVKLLERLRERRLDVWETEVARDQETFAAEAFLAQGIRLKRRELTVKS